MSRSDDHEPRQRPVVLVAGRGAFEQRHLASADFSRAPAGGIYTFELVAGTVSATEVRGLVAAGAPDERLRPLLPAPVLDYIETHRLYRPLQEKTKP